MQPVDTLSQAQINLINIYEKYLVLIHRRLKWKERIKMNLGENSNVDKANSTKGRVDITRKRTRSQVDGNMNAPINKTTKLQYNTKQGDQSYEVISQHYIYAV